MSETKSKDKEGWYPGKLINKRKASVFGSSSSKSSSDEASESRDGQTEPPVTDVTSNTSATEEVTHTTTTPPQNAKTEKDKPTSTAVPTKEKEKEKDGWYPGKFVGMKPKDSPSAGGSKRTPSFVRNNFPLAGKPPVKTVGNVIIKILGVKYMSATRPSFEVWLGTQVETFQFLGLEQDGSSSEEFEGFFSLGDLTSDVVVLVKEEYKVGGGGSSSMKGEGEENFVGRVVIPLPSYLTLQGRKAPHKEWMAVYPLANPKNPMDAYQSGLHELPASGMPKSKQSLGFLCVQIELLLPEGPVYKQYLEGEPPRASRRILASSSDAGTESSRPEGAEKVNKKERGGNFDPEKFYRICQRLQHFCSTPPAALAPVLKFPEVFVAIALYGFLCFGATAANLPIIFFLAVVLNGVLSKRSSSNLVLWNEMLDHEPSAALVDPHSGKPLSLALKRSPEYVYQHLQSPLYDCQVFIEKLVNFLEVMSNMWNFSDVRASVVFYGFLGVLVVLSTLILVIFSARLLFFLVGAALLLLNSLRDVFPELFSLETLYEMLTSEEHDEKFQAVRNVFAKFWLVFTRVPNQKTMVHRQIARSCVVDEGGEEMKDAALKMKNM